MDYAFGQEDEKEIYDYFPSENIDASRDFNKKVNKPKEKNILFIIKNSNAKILYGNPCVIDETHRMGFEYSIQIRGLPGSVNGWARFWKNSGVFLKLSLTKGPWWKWTLNKRIKDCRKRSGELLGYRQRNGTSSDGSTRDARSYSSHASLSLFIDS